MRNLFLFLFAFLGITGTELFGQNQKFSDEVFLEKLNFYTRSHPDNLLFVHTDKNIYTNNEVAWFSAYLIKSVSVAASQHTILSVGIVRADDRQVYCREKFAMRDGLAFGSLNLPDSLPPGNYQLLAYTNVMDDRNTPLAVFSQSLVIKSITETDFDVRLSLLDSVPINDAVRAKVQVEMKNPDPKYRLKPTVEYSIGGNGFKQVKTDEYNRCVLTIPSSQLDRNNPVLLTAVRYKDQVQYSSLLLPGTKPVALTVKFYPEGGFLVDGLPCTVGWESKTTDNLSVPVTGILLRDGQAIDTLTSNSYGVGSFRLVPDGKSRYSFKVEESNLSSRELTYDLPSILADGVSLHLEKAVVNDKLQFQVQSRHKTDLRVIIHDFRDGYASFPFSTPGSRSNQTVVLEGVPKGLATITIIDKEGRPLAERLFFAHFDQQVAPQFEGQKERYAKREKVEIRLRISDRSGIPVQGVISMACVQANRLEETGYPDIESYVLISSKLSNLPVNPMGRAMGNEDYLENVLLIRGWRKYSWQALMSSSAQDTTRTFVSPILKGRVSYFGKPLRKPVPVTLMKGMTEFNLIDTDNHGDFQIPESDLLIAQDKILMATVNTGNKDGYQIKLLDPYIEYNQLLASQLTINYSSLFKGKQSSKEFELTGMQHVTQLKEFVIKAGGSDNSIYGAKKGSNACGDYVIDNILYYPHVSKYYTLTKDNPYRTQPVKGFDYIDGIKIRRKTGEIGYRGDGNPGKFSIIHVMYMGCMADRDKTLFRLDGIYTTREFYGFDEKLKDFSDTQLLSTIYWKPGVVITRDGYAECSFYTGDITGKFKLIVQGAWNKDLIYGEKTFEVK